MKTKTKYSSYQGTKPVGNNNESMINSAASGLKCSCKTDAKDMLDSLVLGEAQRARIVPGKPVAVGSTTS